MSFLPLVLPQGFIPIIKQSDSVKIGQVLAQKTTSSEVSLALTKELGIKAKEVAKFLKKQPGEKITPGEIIAQKKNVFGRITAKVVSKTIGTITRFERDTGELFILIEQQENNTPETFISPIEGTILVCNNEKIVIQTEKNAVVGTKGFGPQVFASLYILEDVETVDPYHIQSDAIGGIVVGRFFPREVLVKSVSIGVKAVIASKVLDTDIYFLTEKKLQLPLIEVDPNNLGKIREWHGRNVFLDGETKTIILLHN